MYNVSWSPESEDDLENVSPEIALRIVDKVEEYLAIDPISLGRSLTGKFKGLYRYRIGDYRVIYEVQTKERIIYLAQIGHRGSVY